MVRCPRSTVLALLLTAAVLLPGCLGNFFGPDRTEWAFESTGLAAVAKQGLTGKGVKVAIVDTGLDRSHADLNGVTIAHWRDYVNAREQPYDDHGHGTHVAGILAANGAIVGGAPGVTLLVYKAISADGKGRDSDVAAAIRDSTAQGADVICLSLGGGRLPILGSATSNAAQAAVNRGVFVVAAAGNDGKSEVETPADERGVIAVGAMTEGKRVASFSNRGAAGDPGLVGVVPREAPHQKPEVVAPGVGILSTWRGGDEYRLADGTSQATPFVCASLALLLEKQPGLKRQSADTVTTVKRALMETAEKLPDQKRPHDPAAGYGLVRADRLVARYS